MNYIIGLDTETCNGIVVDDKLDLSQSLVYDIGWAVTDRKGNIYKTRSFIVREIFFGMSDVMQTAYYSEKIPMYLEQIADGSRIVANFATIRARLLEDIAEYKVKEIFAHNMSFDLNALNVTQRYISKSKYRYFFPYGIELWDTLKMARQTIGKQKRYRKFCEQNGYMTNHKVPRVRLTAEILYRYLTKDNDFVESHTGLEDVLIETHIMMRCFKTHKKMEKRLFTK